MYSPGSGAISVRDYVDRGLSSAQKGHNWFVMVKDFPLRVVQRP